MMTEIADYIYQRNRIYVMKFTKLMFVMTFLIVSLSGSYSHAGAQLNTWYVYNSRTCTGPVDTNNRMWYVFDYDYTSPELGTGWSTTNMIYKWRDSKTDRFFRYEFELATPNFADSIRFSTDDGFWLYVNGKLMGHWGGDCHGHGTVNAGRKSKSLMPISFSSLFHEGHNVIAIHVSNGAGGSGHCLVEFKCDGVWRKDVLLVPKNLSKINDDKIKNEQKNKTSQIVVCSDIDSIAVVTKTARPDGIAIIIGIENYKNTPAATFASKDAKTFEKYAHQALGIPVENIYTITNEAATLGEFMKLFGKNGYLARRTNDNTDIFIYYSGHGAPDFETKVPYLIPYDVDPNYPTTGYSTNTLYENLGLLEAKSITVFLDACFSGATRSNEMLLANARPVRIEMEKSAIPDNITLITASSGAQISSGYPKEGHGLFSYFLMKGLQNYSDKDSDSKITLEELYDYIKENVSKTAGKMDREQTPELITNKSGQILLEY